jgi:hypothetical protein
MSARADGTPVAIAPFVFTERQPPAPVWAALRPPGLASRPVKAPYHSQSLQQRAQQILSSKILNAHKICRAQRKLIHHRNRSDRDKALRADIAGHLAERIPVHLAEMRAAKLTKQ